MKFEDNSVRPPPYPRDVLGRFKRGKGRVICTHFFQKRKLSRKLWELDIQFTAEHLHPSTVRGYQLWAIPYVRLMRKYHWAEAVMLPLAIWRANEIAFQMGAASIPDYRGKLVRLIGEPLCWLLGQLVGEQDWQSLYKPQRTRT